MSQNVSPAQIATLRGVKNCGRHHEEDRLSPALQFARECDQCAAHIFATIYNSGIEAGTQNALSVVRGHRCR